MILVTYLPFYRMHEVELYFDRNVEVLKPDRSVVYVDNVFNPRQEEIARRMIKHEVKFGNWGNRGSTWFSMLKDLGGEKDVVVFVDSDNVLCSDLKNVKLDDQIYTVLDFECWERGAEGFMRRSREGEEICAGGRPIKTFFYKIYEGSMFSRGPNFFIGPKQAIAFRRLPSASVIEGVERAFNRVPHILRNVISDETVLGTIAHLMGLREVRWFVCSHHYHHGSTPSKAFKLFVARAHAAFAKGLYSEFKSTEFLKYWIKYRIIFVKEALKEVL